MPFASFTNSELGWLANQGATLLKSLKDRGTFTVAALTKPTILKCRCAKKQKSGLRSYTTAGGLIVPKIWGEYLHSKHVFFHKYKSLCFLNDKLVWGHRYTTGKCVYIQGSAEDFQIPPKKVNSDAWWSTDSMLFMSLSYPYRKNTCSKDTAILQITNQLLEQFHPAHSKILSQ